MAEPKTSTISRPRAARSSTVAKPARARRASDAGRSRVGDLTRPIAIDRRILRRRQTSVLLGVFALAIAGSLAAALFVLPVQTYFAQDETITRREGQLRELDTVNADLAAEVARLRTDDGIREAAREELGYVEAGEARLSLVSPATLPTVLPDGWPYSVVSGIIAVRSGATSPP
jgi:cell division protein FtsB